MKTTKLTDTIELREADVVRTTTRTGLYVEIAASDRFDDREKVASWARAVAHDRGYDPAGRVDVGIAVHEEGGVRTQSFWFLDRAR